MNKSEHLNCELLSFSNILFSKKRIVKSLSIFLTAILIVSGFFIFNAGVALATHTASVTISPQYVQGGATDTYNFTVTNNGSDAIYKIVITAPGGFTVNNDPTCPTGWVPSYTDTSIQCLTDGNPTNSDLLTSGSSEDISLSAVSPISDEQYIWTVNTSDNAWGTFQNTDAKTTVDVTPPAIGIITIIPTPYNDGTTNYISGTSDISASVDETGSGVASCEYTLDGSIWTAGNYSKNACSVSGIDTSSASSINFRATDNVGNLGTGAAIAVTPDTTAPETSISVGTPNYGIEPVYVKSTTEFTLDATDGGSGLASSTSTKYQIDTGSENEYFGPFKLGEYGVGAHTISYWSVDNIGNIETAKTLSVYVDNLAPSVGDITITPSYNDGTTNYISGTSDISAPVNDEDGSGVASCEYTLNTGADTPTWSEAVYDSENNLCTASSIDTSGATSINMRATDNVGNTGEGTTAIAVMPDTTAPAISDVLIAPSSPTNNNTPTISFTLSDSGSGIKSDSVQIFDGTNTYIPTCSDGSCSYTFSSPLADGTYNFVISASDNIGNSASDSSSLSGYIIDTQTPTTSDDYGTKDGAWQNQDQTIALTPADTGNSGIEWTKYCTDDGTTACDPASGTDYTSPVTISTEGITYFRYASKDNAGNVQTPVSREIKIDETSPIAGVNGAPGDWTNETQTATVVCSDQEGLSECNAESYKLYTSSSEITSCPTDKSAYTVSNNSQITSHSWICAYAEDNAENGTVSSPVEFKVDEVPPSASLTGVPINWQNSDASIGLTSSDEGGSEIVNSYLDVVAYGNDCTATTAYTEGSSITVNEHSTACWKIVDNAGNEATGTGEIKVDETKSTSGINSPDAGSWQNEDFDVSISDSDTGGSDLTACYYRVLSTSVPNADTDDSSWEYTAGDASNWAARDCGSVVNLTVGETGLCKYEGENTCKIQVKAVDNAGNDNWGPSYEIRKFSIDREAPTVAISSPAQNQVAISALSVSTNVTDNIDTSPTCAYNFDSNSNKTDISCSGGDVVVSGLSEGHHILHFYATDLAGNQGSNSVDFIVNNDTILTVDDTPGNNPDFTTIQDAIDAAGANDTISVAAGTYNESVLIEKQLTLAGPAEGAKPVITGDDSANNYIVKVAGATDVIINNVEVNGGGVGTGDNAFDYGILVDNSGTASNPVEISNSIVKNIWKISSNGIEADNGSYVLMHDNIVSSFHKRGIRFINSGGKVYNNEVYGEDVNGVDRVQNLVNLWGGSNVEIYGNNLHNALTVVGSTSLWDSPAIFVSSYGGDGASYANIHDNEIYNGDTGIVVGSYYADTDTSSADITNNHLHNLNWAINFEKGTISATITDNKFVSVNRAVSADDGDGGPATKPTVNAEKNYWGTAVLSTIQSKVYENVDFEPYYVNEDMTILSNSAPVTVYVDDGYLDGNAGNHIFGYDAFATIQDAISAVAEEGTVNVAAGIYDEQVVIEKSLTLQGAGNSTVVQPSQTTANNFQLFARYGGGSTAGIIVVNTNGSSVTVKNLKINGDDITSIPTPANGLVGIFYRETGGSVDNINVEKINIANGNGVYAFAENNDVTVEIKNSTLTNYLKNGITVNGSTITGNIHGNIVTGMGATDTIAQNGIQIGFEATGAISNNTISDNVWTGTYGGSNDPASDVEADGATGILLYHSAGTVEAKNNTLTNNQFGVWAVGANAVNIHDNTITGLNNTGNAYPAGIAVWSADQWSEDYFGYTEVGTTGVINNNTITANDYGILVRDYITDGVAPDISISSNQITDNAIYGVWSNIGTTATPNWWGSATGPYNPTTNVGGTGNAVSDNVTYRSWCSESSCSVTDSDAPYVASHIPSVNAVGVNPSNDITITFDEDVQCNAENGDWANCIAFDPAVSGGTISYASNVLTFTPPADGLASNQNYTTTLSNIEDKSGNLLTGNASWQFTTANHYSIPVYTGWNLISIPTVPINTSINDVLGSAASAIDSVWTYDAINNIWYVAHPNNSDAPGDLTDMTAGYGYWISATSDTTISGYGNLFSEQQTPPQRTLTAGWNLIGYYQKAGVNSIPVHYALSTLSDDYCNQTQKYWTSLVGYNNASKSFVNTVWDSNMSPNNAYWIFMKSSSIGTYMYGPGEINTNCP